jgi:hypothetical protein
VYLRRWSIDPFPDGSNRGWVLQVLVTDLRSHAAARFAAAKAGKAF